MLTNIFTKSRSFFELFSTLTMSVQSSTVSATTAAIIVIGDEILKGYTLDTNSNFLCKRLRQLGVSVNRITVIPDCVETIADEVRKCSAKYTYVLTSGGIGPTHDDMTFEGIAKGMDDRIVINDELSAAVEKFFGKQAHDSTPAMKLAQIPSKATLIWGIHKKTGKPSLYPVVTVGNVTVLPGVPKLMEMAFDMIEDRYKNAHTTFYNEKVYVTTDEVSIADGLTDLAKRYEGKVQLGSYPKFGHSYYKVKLTLDSTDKTVLDESLANLLHALPSEHIINYDEFPELDAAAKFDAYLTRLSAESPEFHAKVAESVAIVEEALKSYKWEELSVAFNGGKDCTALLHLVYVVACKRFGDLSDQKLRAIYLRPRLPFDEVEQFVEESKLRYSLDIFMCTGKIKEALFDLTKAHTEIKAVFMGTRASDPNSHLLDAFAKTDPGWPDLMRVSPMIKWTYGETWRFLRALFIPYCTLYDQGYTSLGNKDNTEKNPSLEYVDAVGFVRHKPAYLLENELLEREGRKVNGV